MYLAASKHLQHCYQVVIGLYVPGCLAVLWTCLSNALRHRYDIIERLCSESQKYLVHVKGTDESQRLVAELTEKYDWTKAQRSSKTGGPELILERCR